MTHIFLRQTVSLGWSRFQTKHFTQSSNHFPKKTKSCLPCPHLTDIPKQRLDECATTHQVQYAGNWNALANSCFANKEGIVMRQISPSEKNIELVLCPVCSRQFYNTRETFIRRANPYQVVRDTCSYCNIRSGWDYIVTFSANARHSSPIPRGNRE